MAKVDLKALEAIGEKQEKENLLTQIQEKVVGGVKVFKGPSLEDWFDDYGECILANSEAKRQAEYEKAGLDTFGRTKEQVAMSSKKAELLAKKAALVADIKKIDLAIQQLKAEDFKEVKKAKK